MACSAGSSSRQAVHQVAQNVSRTGLPLKSARLTLLPESDQEVKPGAVPPTWATPPVTVAVLADLPIVIIATAVAVAMTTTSSGRARAHLGTGRVGGLSFRALPDSIIESASRAQPQPPRVFPCLALATGICARESSSASHWKRRAMNTIEYVIAPGTHIIPPASC